ncbi:MAG: ABC transporter ATP-binding protein [Bacteroidota bacterium]
MNTITPTEPARPMYRLIKYLGRYRSQVWFSVTSSIVNKIFDLMPPFLTAWMIDSVSGNIPGWLAQLTGLQEPWPVIVFLSILTLVIFGFESLFEWMYKLGFMRLAQSVQHDLRLDAYAALQKREIAYFETQRTGNLMAMLNDDINQLERFLNNSFNEIIQLITLLIFAGGSLCLVSPTLGLVGMIPIPLIVIGSIYYQRKVAPYYREVREAVGQLSTRLENNISGIMVIKSFTAETYERQRVAKNSAAYREANFKAIRLSSRYVPLIRILIAFGFAATLLMGSYWVLNGHESFTIGGLAFFAMMIQRLLWPITRLGVVFDEFERARASSRRVFGLVDAPALIQSVAKPHPTQQFKGQIELNNVSFEYDRGQAVLRQINLLVPSGQTIGIAGPTGSGKTSLIKLLLRFYEVNQGNILIDGVDIRQIHLTSLRQNIALVSQEVYLFHGTIEENIAYGKTNVKIEEVRAAAQKAQLHDFITQLPDAYQSIIGERGIKLSGGQRQRLSIARAILKDAPILILDEATSAVDTETERAIQENLNQLTQGKTAVIIAHRLSTIRHAHKIVVLKKGQIHEQGSHTELVDQGGVYADLWKVQIGELTE